MHDLRSFGDRIKLPCFPGTNELFMLVVEDRGRLVGGALAFRRNPRGVTLRIIGLDPSVRGTGFGRRLVERIEEEAAHLGVGAISLGADDEALGFYTHLGYAEAGGALHKHLERADLTGAGN